MSRPRFARRVRGRRALTLAFAPRLIIQLSGECQILSSSSPDPAQACTMHYQSTLYGALLGVTCLSTFHPVRSTAKKPSTPPRLSGGHEPHPYRWENRHTGHLKIGRRFHPGIRTGSGSQSGRDQGEDRTVDQGRNRSGKRQRIGG